MGSWSSPKFIDCSVVAYRKEQSWTDTQVAAFMEHPRDTLGRVLRTPVDRRPARTLGLYLNCLLGRPMLALADLALI